MPAAALIRGNRNNCTQFSNNLDWLVSKLERLESSSGTPGVTLKHLVRRVTGLKTNHTTGSLLLKIYTKGRTPSHPVPSPLPKTDIDCVPH